MSTSSHWRARPVFVSGTFRDMHEERDLLAHRAFRTLEEEMGKHFTILERVDLRVGVETRGLADDHAKQELVLKVCLDDVKRCRPFLIVLVGDRYGWVPPIDRSRAAAGEAGFRTALEGKSVTALEIEFGLWGDPDQQTRSRIYFRRLDYTGMTEADAIVYCDERAAVSPLVSADERAPAAERAAALAASKQRLRTDPVLGPRCRDYDASWDPIARKVTGLGPFIDDVVRDLLPEMIAEAREQVAAARAGTLPTPLQQFVAERSRGFRGRTDIVGQLCAYATEPGDTETRGRVVAGVSGGGKSAVFARVYEELESAAGDGVWLLAHAAGIDPRSSSVLNLLEGWVAALADKLGVENPLAISADGPNVRETGTTAIANTRPKPEEVFANLLARAAASKRVVLLLDALDRFERTPQAEHVTWLPPRLPANVRLIATAVTGPETNALARRPDVVVEPLAPLTADEALEIAQSVYERYHRQPNTFAVRELIDKPGPDGTPARGNALWLVSAIEELNLLDGDDFRRAEAGVEATDEDRLHAMVVGEGRAMPGDIERLYARIFERAGRRVSDDPGTGAALARAFVVAIAVSRTGFRERDLAALIPGIARLLAPSSPELTWDALAFASLRRALRAHLVRRGEDDRWDFHHRQARSAAERAYVPEARIRKGIHQLVANHLLRLEKDNPLHETETMVHLMQTGDLRQAAAFYGSDLTAAEATGATAALATLVLDGHEVKSVASLLDQPVETSLKGRAGERFLFELNQALENRAPTAARVSLHRAAERAFIELDAADRGQGNWQRDLAVSHQRIGDALKSQANLLGALAAFRACLAIAERLAATDPGNADWQRDLSVSHIKVGDVLTAQGNLPGALTAFHASHRIFERLAAADNAGWQQDLAVSHERIGNVLRAQGNLPGALTAFHASLAIAERLAAADPGNADWQQDLSVSHDKVGDVLRAQGNLLGALTAFQASFDIRNRLAAADPSNAGWQRDLSVSAEWIGDVLRAQGNLPGALTVFQASFEIRNRLAAADPGNAGWQRDLSVSHDKVGNVLQAQGNLPGALTAFHASLAIAERLAAADPGNAGWQQDLSVSHDKVGDVLRAQGNLPGALTAFHASLAIAERLAAADPGNADWQQDLSVSHDKVGDVLRAQGNLPGALTAFQASFEIRNRLAAADRGNAGWQRALSVSHNKIGDVLWAQGNMPGAFTAFLASHRIFERLAGADPGNEGWQRDLSVSHNKIGDVLRAQGNLPGALTAFHASLAIAERLAAADPGNAGWQRDLSVSYIKLGDVLWAQGNLPGALAAFQAGHRVFERLAAADPCNADWQQDLSVSHKWIGNVLQAQGNLPGALTAFHASLDIAERLAAADPGNADWQRDLVASNFTLASHLQEAQDSAATEYWRRCRDVLRHMKASGMFLDPPLVELLAALDGVSEL